LWIKFLDGTQTTADAYLVDRFGADPNYPWEADMIGRGMAIAICTARLNRKMFPSVPTYRFEVDGYEMTDPRGDDEQENPVVAIRTILKGVSYGGDWFYGPQKISDYALPSANWEGEMDKCDALVTLADESTEKRFRFGMEIKVDTEPHVVIGELLKACNGRIAEIGGIYKVLVAEPNASVLSFDDEDLIVTEGQTFEPFPGLEATHNAIAATYPEPDEAWEMKEAPPLYDADLEAEDDGRRLVADTAFKAVPHALQVQRLMLAMRNEARRFRRHSFTGGPQWWEYEPLDAVSWTSARNGYASKLFLNTAIDDLDDMLQVVGLHEQDPADNDWSADDQVDYDTAPVVVGPPGPQAVNGWAVSPATIYDANGIARRPSIQVSFDGSLADIEAVLVTVRLQSSGAVVFFADIPYGDPATGTKEVVLNGTFLPATDYEVQGELKPFAGQETTASAWLAVTTPDVRAGLADIDAAVGALLAGYREDLDRLLQQVPAGFTQMLLEAGQSHVFRQSIRAQANALEAVAATEQIARIDGDRSLAQLVGLVSARSDGAAAAGLYKLEAEADAGSAEARFGVYLRADTEADFLEASEFFEIVDVGGGSLIARKVIIADRFYLQDTEGNLLAAADEDGFFVPERFKAGSIEATSLKVLSITADQVAGNAFNATGSSQTSGDSSAITNGSQANRDEVSFAFNGTHVHGIVTGNWKLNFSGSGTIRLRLAVEYHDGDSWTEIISTRPYTHSKSTSGTDNVPDSLSFFVEPDVDPDTTIMFRSAWHREGSSGSSVICNCNATGLFYSHVKR
ncbi:MAG: hypothetical protein VYD64_02145, partial [Pseudomonadota bacterium]|nr:hypothetical protein [Pseudomonadota bacterium]